MPKKRRRGATRRTRSRKRQDFQHRLHLLSISFIVVFASVVLYGGIHIYRFFAKPLVSASTPVSLPQNSATWDAVSPLNIVVFSLESPDSDQSLLSDLAVLHISPFDGKLSFVTVPVDFKTSLPHGFGANYLKTLYAIGNLDDFGGVSLIKETTSSLLAIPIDSYLMLSRSDFRFLVETLENAHGLAGIGEWGDFIFQASLESDLNVWSDLRLLQFILAVKSSDKSFLSAPVEDIAVLDEMMQNYFDDPVVTNDRAKVLVLNGTQTSGLATAAARFVSNLGADVLATDNAPRREYRFSILVSQEKTPTVEKLTDVFGVLDFRTVDSLGDDPLLDRFRRADVVLILGEDCRDLIN